MIEDKKGSSFHFTVSVWKDCNNNYIQDSVMIILKVQNDGSLGCETCGNCFGKTSHTHGEFSAHKH